MSLRFVIGRSGAGKTYTVSRELIERSCKHPEKQFLVIVPEQFTMQTQKELVQMHPAKGLLNLDVLSFNRLAWRVFEEVGGNTLPVVEEIGKSLLLQRIITEHADELKVCGKTLSRRGAVSLMKSLVSELMQYRVQAEDLEEWIRSVPESGRLAFKLEDIRLIYTAFRKELEGRYRTVEELPQVLCRVIGDSSLVRGSEIVLDGFTGFTPVQLEVVNKLLQLADRVTVVVTLPEDADPYRAAKTHELFCMSHTMIRKVKKLADEDRIETEPVLRVSPAEKSRFSGNKALAHLEANLFRYRVEPFAGEPSGIRILNCADPSSEIRQAAASISRMVRTQGYRYRDFALITGDLETYGAEAVRLLEEAGIPCFLDQKQAVMANRAVEFVRSAVDLMSSNYTYDSVMRYVRTGLSGLSMEEADIFDNYILALGIRGFGKYDQPWVRMPDGMKYGDLLFLNELRERFMEGLRPFHAAMHERMADGRRRAAAVYELCVLHQVQEVMEKTADAFEEKGERSKALEYRRIYPVLCDLLNHLVEVLGDEKMKTADFQELLDAGLAECSIGLVPPGEDQVLIGDLQRTRLKRIRVLFFAGINEGIIPRQSPARGILSEFDREVLEKNGAQLSPNAREEMYQQRFYLYLMLTRPSDGLVLSCSRTSADGSEKTPSYLLGLVGRLFPELAVETVDLPGTAETDPELGAARLAMVQEALRELRQKPVSPEALEIMRHMAAKPGTKALLEQLLHAAASRNPEESLSMALARSLYGDRLAASVTRLELFASCAFRHFLSYGLRLQEREVYEVTPADFGTVCHKALELFSRKVKKDRLDWASLPDPERDGLAEQALLEAVYGYGDDILSSSARSLHMIDRLSQIVKRTVWALQEQLKRGEFRPSDFEFVFSDELQSVNFTLGEDTQVRLAGKIDRVDVCDRDGTHYIKIIDYKTGSTSLDLPHLYYGLQLQLAVYMNAALEQAQKRYGRSEPAGIFYYRILDPFVEPAEGQDPEEQILRELRPRGLFRSENEVLSLFDREFGPGESSQVIAATRKKDGELRATGDAAALEGFEVIAGYADAKVRSLAGEMLSGQIRANPYQEKELTACTWCPYGSVCGFDRRVPGYTYRELVPMTAEDAAEAMKKKTAELRRSLAADGEEHAGLDS